MNEAPVERVAFTPAEAARIAGVSLDSIRNAYRSGELICHYRSPQRPVILRDDLVAWIAAAPTERASA